MGRVRRHVAIRISTSGEDPRVPWCWEPFCPGCWSRWAATSDINSFVRTAPSRCILNSSRNSLSHALGPSPQSQAVFRTALWPRILLSSRFAERTARYPNGRVDSGRKNCGGLALRDDKRTRGIFRRRQCQWQTTQQRHPATASSTNADARGSRDANAGPILPAPTVKRDGAFSRPVVFTRPSSYNPRRTG